MGGIFGLVCRDRIKPGAILEGLRRLLYRGYDGAGVAYLDEEGRIRVRKDAGHLEEVAGKIDLVNIPSRIALGHTRYASRGWPSPENTHPLLDCRGRIAVVGDGIIENYEEKRDELVGRGHRFSSRTDTEVFAHLVEEHIGKGEGIVEAIALAGRELEGLYSIALIREGDYSIYLLNRGQPLVIGREGGCVYVSSDIPSLYGFASEAVIVPEDCIAKISPEEVKVYSIHTLAEVRELTVKRVKYPVEVVDKAGYPHYMLKEIYEVPEAMARTTVSLMEKYLRLASMIIYGAKNTYIVGNGTSLHAGLVASYYFTDLAGINVNVVSAAEFPYYALENITTGTVILAISQSGETSDVITSIKLAKQRGAVIVGMTNVVGSRLTLESNVYLPIGAGPEIAVPATKTFTSTLTALAILAAYTGLYTGEVTGSEVKELYNTIKSFSRELARRIPGIDREAGKLASKLAGWSDLYVSSSGINYPIALEAALKFKEAASLHAEGVQLGELRHGPMVLVRTGYPVILVKPVEKTAIELYNKVAREVVSRGGSIITVSMDGEGYGDILRTIEADRILAPIASIIPLQLLAYRIGYLKGLPIDTPPGLAKAITT